jgi:hypothetical protein
MSLTLPCTAWLAPVQELRLPPLLTMHNVSLPTFQQLARHFVDSLPSVELSFNVPDVLAQWVAGVVQVCLRGVMGSMGLAAGRL